jgi:hypothetical protein
MDPGQITDELGRTYSRLLRHYRALCAVCHSHYDHAHRNGLPRPVLLVPPECEVCGDPVMAGQSDEEGNPAHLECQRRTTT